MQAPSRKGFGSVLLQRVLGRQLGGEVEVTYAQKAFVCASSPWCRKYTDAR